MPKVSIITPIYCDTSQKVDWLGETIESVLKQTLADWEMILIDDKSPVSPQPIRARYTDNRLRWFANAENYGTARTRNTAVALAESDCILPLDSDDLLGDNETLEVMYDAWIMDKTKIIYGNIQFMTADTPNTYRPGKVLQLAPYSFDNVMDLRGALPVTCMHSIDCHQNTIAEIEPGVFASGWKPILEHGREDVEYWIAAGKRGYCGLKIDHTTLIYRRHQQSRDYNLKISNNLESMQRLIKTLHKDVYGGQFPMACCGKSGTQSSAPVVDPMTISHQAQQKEVRIVTTLDGYNEADLEWVAYRGPKLARSGSIIPRGPNGTPNEYPVLGYGHVFQIHKAHRQLFEKRQTLGFEMNQPDPRQDKPSQEPEPQLPRIVPEAPPVPVEQAKPALATIERLDVIASRTRQADVRGPMQPSAEVIIEPTPPESVSYSMPIASLDVSNLDLGKSLTETLDGAAYTVETLAESTVQELKQLPGIGQKRAEMIIDKAKEYLK